MSTLYFGLVCVRSFSGAGKSCLKLFVLRLLRIKGIQSGGDIVAAGNFFQHLLQIGRLEIEVNRAAYSAECNSARAGVPHESRDRIREGKFIRRQPFWTVIRKSRCGIILRIKSIGGDTMQEVDHLSCGGKRSFGVCPKRFEIARTIKRLDSGSVLRPRHVLLEFILDLQGFGAVPPLVTDIDLSMDDRFLYDRNVPVAVEIGRQASIASGH